jgi:phenylacetate-CoA ligase
MASLLDAIRGDLPGIHWPPLVEGPAAAVLALARQLEQTQWLDADALRSRQFGQVARTAGWLASHSPAFARRLSAAGLSADELGAPDKFVTLPVIDRRWFSEQADVDCKSVPRGHEPVGTNVTSGSTGEFIRVRRTKACQIFWLAMVLRDHGWRWTDFTVPLATVRATNPAIEAFPDWGPPVSWLFDTGPAHSLPINLPGDQLLARLAEIGTGNLVIYPNALGTLVDACEADGRRLDHLKAIRTVGEMVSDRLRQRTLDILGIEIADSYTCQEAGYIALQCPESGLYHLMSETLIVEILRPDGTACDEGEIGQVAITDIHNHATPIVRYALGDHAVVGGPCPCGRGLPTLRRIVGRSRNLVRLPDGERVWPSLGGFGAEGYLHVLPILQFQVRQTELDLLEVHLVTKRPLTAAEEQLLVDRTRQSLGHPFRLEIRYFEGRLPLPPSGKFEDFICLV